MKILARSFILILSLAFAERVFAEGAIASEVLAKAKKAIVTIHTRVSMSAYKQNGSWSGTGFIADKKQGLIITNAHVVGLGQVGSYIVTFDTGQQTEAKLVYYDLWQDMAFLKIDPSVVPAVTTEIVFSKDEPVTDQTVFIIGNNEGQDFSFHSGYISSLYDINGEMPQHSYIVNLNTAGGSSGSPLLNTKGEAIGLHYGGSQTFGISLKGAYVVKALAALKAGSTPTRKHIGVLCELYSLDKAVKHRDFPSSIMADYLKQFPDTRNRVVAVQSTIAGSPAEVLLKPGDIIWKIDGKPVGASLYVLDDTMNSSKSESVKLTIYRDGKLLEQEVKLYDVEENKIKRMLQFAGATFFEADDHMSAKSGIPLKALSLMNAQTGSSFSTIPLSFVLHDNASYRLAFESIGGRKTTSIDELMRAAPELIRSKFVKAEFRNYQPFFQTFGNALISAHALLASDITFDSTDTKSRLLKFDPIALEWVSEDVPSTNSGN